MIPLQLSSIRGQRNARDDRDNGRSGSGVNSAKILQAFVSLFPVFLPNGQGSKLV